MSILDKDSNMEDHWSNNPRFKEQDMSTQDTGGPAFPLNIPEKWYEGMTLRDYFAAKAMQGYLTGDALLKASDTAQEWIDKTAVAAYQMADAMLKARNQ